MLIARAKIRRTVSQQPSRTLEESPQNQSASPAPKSVVETSTHLSSPDSGPMIPGVPENDRSFFNPPQNALFINSQRTFLPAPSTYHDCFRSSLDHDASQSSFGGIGLPPGRYGGSATSLMRQPDATHQLQLPFRHTNMFFPAFQPPLQYSQTPGIHQFDYDTLPDAFQDDSTDFPDLSESFEADQN